MKKFLEDFANEKMAAKQTELSRGKNVQKRNEANPASIQIVIACCAGKGKTVCY